MPSFLSFNGLAPARRAAGRLPGLCAAVLLAALAGCATVPPPADADVDALIRRAEAALGSTAMTTLAFRGRGFSAAVGQAHAPQDPWPERRMRAFSRAMHFDERAYREEFVHEPVGSDMAAPGSASRGVVLARQAFSWDVVGIDVAPAQTSWVSRMHDLWLSTPQGALKAAGRHDAQAGRRRVGWRVLDTLSFVVPGQFSATLLLEPDGRVSRIESVLPDPVRGDVAVLTEFLDYQPRGTLRFPQRIVQRQDGVRVLDVQVGSVVLDGHVEITVPENVRTSGNAPAVEFLSPGVWLLAGGTHHSVLVEQSSQLVLVEAPLDDDRGRALVAAARRVAGTKPLGAVIVTHHHLDHVGGVRVLVGEGAEVLISETAQPWLQASLMRPLTRRADPLDERAGPPRVRGLGGRWLLDDAQRPLEVHALSDSPHASSLQMVWLPRERLLIQVDAWTPGAAGGGAPGAPDPAAVWLVEQLARLGLSPLRIVSLHSRVLPAAELYRAAGRAVPR